MSELPHAAFVLPTADMIVRLQTDLARMVVCEYDLSEIICTAVRCLEHRDMYTVEILRYCDIHSHHGSMNGQPTPDGVIMSKAFLVFATALADLYGRANLWDKDGNGTYYFHRLLKDDMVICPFPP